jgi:hypothetical protein
MPYRVVPVSRKFSSAMFRLMVGVIVLRVETLKLFFRPISRQTAVVAPVVKWASNQIVSWPFVRIYQ